MEIQFTLNGKRIFAEIEADTMLFDLLRKKGCYSVKCGCDTTNCGLCTVLLDGVSVLSCATLAARVEKREVVTLEGMKEEAELFGMILAEEGSDQCGYCSPGFIMNVISMERELKNPTDDEIKEYLAGNLCRCTGYMGQLRAIRRYLNREEMKG